MKDSSGKASPRNRAKKTSPASVPPSAPVSAPTPAAVPVVVPVPSTGPKAVEGANAIPKRPTVVFEYFNPHASEVQVAGSFNQWQPQSLPMRQRLGGKWSAEIQLPPGRYEYRFVVDGEWRDDPTASSFVANSYGGLNCVLRVEPSTPPGSSGS